MIFKTTLSDASSAIGVDLSPTQLEQLEAHWHQVLEANRRFNLTRITEPAEAAVKLYADALSAVAWARAGGRRTVRTVLDVGTGPGLPAVAFAVVEPAWHVTAIDATAKKADFVAGCAKTLGLSNLIATHHHSDHWTAPPAGFDLITFRAVGKLEVCIETGHRLLAPGGTLVSYKSRRMTDDERRKGVSAARRRRLTAMADFTYDLPIGDQVLQRLLVVYQRR